jgi:hypothetical protein
MVFQRIFFIVIIFDGLLKPCAVCQSITDMPAKDIIHLQSSNSVIQLYHSLLNDSNAYLNGYVNTFRYPGARGNPYFGDGNWYMGSFILDNRQFTDISLRYEILNDWLLCLHYTSEGPSTIEINISFVRQFSFSGHTFVNFDLIKPNIPGAAGGYYEELASGRACLYIKWRKIITSPSTNNPAEYILQKTPYILLHDTMYRLTNRKSILMALKDRPDELKNYMRKHRIAVMRSSDQELAAVVHFYNSLF